MKKLTVDTPKNDWTQRATPEGTRRSRRITLCVTPAMADRLFILARIDGVSVNHEVELMIDAEYTRRKDDPAAADVIKALERLNG